ncbi:MAG: prepilin-type N-terminal cleavage/methylation domain-containing protein, partial [Heliobacteriaceae bacterium]|nr:prepilin-type N-terminal cleavage/methylation domain-containing protein [Heliobacteriaceae bacterium]
MKKYAFTLSEVLITLGIIGVVAALTMPSLITKYEKQVTVTRLKKFYSIHMQTLKMTEAIEEGAAPERNDASV